EAAKRAEPTPESSLNDSVRELRQQVHELQAAVGEIRQESEHYRADTAELRRELDAVRGASAVVPSPTKVVSSASYGANARQSLNEAPEGQKAQHVASLEEEYQLLSGKIDEQYQTHVECSSKYRVRHS